MDRAAESKGRKPIRAYDMADSGDPNDPLSEEYYIRSRNPQGYVSPAQKQQQEEQRQKATSAEMDKTFPAPVGGPESQFGYGNELLQPVRGAGIALNQMGIGLAGLPLTALNLGWRGAHLLREGGSGDPGEAPAWTYSTGPGSYGNALTVPSLTPQGPWERDLAAGARTVGAELPFIATGLGPVAATIPVIGSVVGQELTEHGHPNIGAAVEMGTGFFAGRAYDPRIPNVLQRWQNVPPTVASRAQSFQSNAAMAQAQQHHDEIMNMLRGMRNIDILSPITHARSFAGALINAGVIGVSGATRVAGRVLGRLMGDMPGNLAGTAIGGSSVSEAQSPINVPPMEFTAPPSFAPPQ